MITYSADKRNVFKRKGQLQTYGCTFRKSASRLYQEIVLVFVEASARKHSLRGMKGSLVDGQHH